MEHFSKKILFCFVIKLSLNLSDSRNASNFGNKEKPMSASFLSFGINILLYRTNGGVQNWAHQEHASGSEKLWTILRVPAHQVMEVKEGESEMFKVDDYFQECIDRTIDEMMWAETQKPSNPQYWLLSSWVYYLNFYLRSSLLNSMIPAYNCNIRC